MSRPLIPGITMSVSTSAIRASCASESASASPGSPASMTSKPASSR